jgi:hypothetical protein
LDRKSGSHFLGPFFTRFYYSGYFLGGEEGVLKDIVYPKKPKM